MRRNLSIHISVLDYGKRLGHVRKLRMVTFQSTETNYQQDISAENDVPNILIFSEAGSHTGAYFPHFWCFFSATRIIFYALTWIWWCQGGLEWNIQEWIQHRAFSISVVVGMLAREMRNHWRERALAAALLHCENTRHHLPIVAKLPRKSTRQCFP